VGFEGIDLADRVLDVVEQRAFGDLELELVRIGAARIQAVKYLRHEGRVVQLARTDVDGDLQMTGLGLPGLREDARAACRIHRRRSGPPAGIQMRF